jgi:hypothetical protein
MLVVFRDQARFWSKVRRAGKDECWLWAGTNLGGRYGQFWLNGKGVLAHRLAWRFAYGDPGGMYVCHRCDVGLCVNPRHLFLGTAADNTADMWRKGRARPPRGERQTQRKLSARQVIEIRMRVAAGERQNVVAVVYGVHPTTISRIVSRENWASVC